MTSGNYPVFLKINIPRYKRTECSHSDSPPVCVDTAMSSQTNNTTIENLQRAYKAVLLNIVRSLEKDQQEELRFIFGELIRKEPGALIIMSSLENAGKISWSDVSFLKEGLLVVKRWDLAEKLAEFEVMRNLTVLLDFYARKRQGISESSCSFVLDSVEKVAGYLLKITREEFEDGFDVTEKVRSLLGESREDIKNLMLEFNQEILEFDQELSDPWSKLTLLIVISGEIFAVALANEEHHQKQEVMKLLYTVAEDLCSRITKLLKGSWVSEK